MFWTTRTALEVGIRLSPAKTVQPFIRFRADRLRRTMRPQAGSGRTAVLTDGEFRRRNFQDSFGNAVSGYDTPSLTGAGFRDPQTWRDAERTKTSGTLI